MNLISEDDTRYAVKVGARLVTQPYSSRMLAEQAMLSLPVEQLQDAQVVPVSHDGKEILLG